MGCSAIGWAECPHRCAVRDPPDAALVFASMTSKSIESISVEVASAGFSALGDPIRLRILNELTGGQQCVCELLDQIGIAANLLSYHLRVLREAGLVEASRRGRWVDYQLAPEGLQALRDAIPTEGAV